MLYHAGPGAGTTYKLPAGDFEHGLRHVGYPDAMIRSMAATWSPGSSDLVGRSGFMVSAATLFPNLSFVHNWPQIDEAGTVAPFVSLRSGSRSARRDRGAVVVRGRPEAPEDFKRESYKAYLMCFGSTGMFEQDDVENWVSITETARGTMARRLLLNSRMGLDHSGRPIPSPHEGFAGPGVAYQGFGEFNQRHWLSMWADAIERVPATSRLAAAGTAAARSTGP